MKKSYLMIAAAAAMFAACSSNDTFKEVDVQEAPIAFEQALNKTTRATIASEANLASEGGFIVYGYKTPTAATLDWTSYQTIFNNENVKSTNSGSTWTYDNLRFWDKTSTYNFFAIAPYSPSAGTYSLVENTAPSALKFKITGATSAISTSSDDFLIDRDGALGVDGDYTGTHAVVGIDFHHIMAKVQFALKSTLASGTVTVTRLVMTGWNSGAGTFTQTLTATPTELVCTEWTIPTAGTGSATLVGSGATQSSIALTCSASATATDVTDWYIMVPQNIAASTLTFTVDYTYANAAGTYSETFTDQVATLTAAQVWGTDSHTTYTLDIKPAAIEFDVTSICGFDVDGGQATPIEVK